MNKNGAAEGRKVGRVEVHCRSRINSICLLIAYEVVGKFRIMRAGREPFRVLRKQWCE